MLNWLVQSYAENQQSEPTAAIQRGVFKPAEMCKFYNALSQLIMELDPMRNEKVDKYSKVWRKKFYDLHKITLNIFYTKLL